MSAPAPSRPPLTGAPAGLPSAASAGPRAAPRAGADFVAALLAAAPRAAPAVARAPSTPPSGAGDAAALSERLWRADEANAPAAAASAAPAPPAAAPSPAIAVIAAAPLAAPAPQVAASRVDASAPPRAAPPADRIAEDRPAPPPPAALPPSAGDRRRLETAFAASGRAAAAPADASAAAPASIESLAPAASLVIVETHLPPARWPQALHRLAEAAGTARPALAAVETSDVASRPAAQVLRLALDPERLGAVSVTLRLRGGALEARLEIDRPETVALVESRRGELVEAFRRAGYEIGDIVLTPAQEGRLRHGLDTGSAAHDPARDSRDDQARRDSGGERGAARGDDPPRRGRDDETGQDRREPRRRDAGAVFRAGAA